MYTFCPEVLITLPHSAKNIIHCLMFRESTNFIEIKYGKHNKMSRRSRYDSFYKMSINKADILAGSCCLKLKIHTNTVDLYIFSFKVSTTRQRSCRKVKFSVTCVCHSVCPRGDKCDHHPWCIEPHCTGPPVPIRYGTSWPWPSLQVTTLDIRQWHLVPTTGDPFQICSLENSPQ